MSARQAAHAHLLVTAKFPVDCLTSTWSRGQNREISVTHKRALRESFARNGVQRTDGRNFLTLVCTKSEVEKMRPVDGDHAPSWNSMAEWPSFMNWEHVVGTHVELSAGQHRVAAFKEFLAERKAEADDRWWIGEIYDRGKPEPQVGRSHRH